jgi:hypothetical protein
MSGHVDANFIHANRKTYHARGVLRAMGKRQGKNVDRGAMSPWCHPA